ncbi:hypothetical protein SPLC1_S411310 [Arthrospira platensis C1]|nr:hypothetical protein SPLC1_S411310 [Arthrospira platensis C1]
MGFDWLTERVHYETLFLYTGWSNICFAGVEYRPGVP